MFRLVLITCTALALPCAAQAPATSTISLSLKTMGKALSQCSEAINHVSPGSARPVLKSVIGESDFAKDMKSLGTAQSFVSALIASPSKITGKALVAVLSTTDDLSVGVGSSRTEVMRHIVLDAGNTTRVEQLMFESESLNNCQTALFNAGDDYVELVMDYVGAEDDIVKSRMTR